MMVSVIIINYNTFRLTSECIASVLKFTVNIPVEVILVDNASTECNPDEFKKMFPSIILVKSQINTGFAGGNNLGLAYASGDIILLLNSDTYLAEDAISVCAEKLLASQRIGAIGCKMRYPDGRIQYTARRFRTIQWELLDLFRPLLYVLPYRKRAILMLGRYFKADFDTECDWLNGAFFMFRKSILNLFENGKLDDRFFMYGEDHLWCLQLKKAGYHQLFCSTTEIIHINSGSTNKKKQLRLKKIMMKHELEIMNSSERGAVYLFFLKLIYLSKEQSRYYIKWIVQKLTGLNLRLF
jgi:GT2 family glycosyltransferase